MRKMLILLLGIAAFFGGYSITTVKASIPTTTEFETQKIIWLGDSITFGYGATAEDKKFRNIVAEELNFASSVSYAVGGATITKIVSESTNFIDIAPTMATDADVIMVMGGINDAFNDVPIGTDTDTDPEATFYGALNDLMTSLKATYTGKRIIFMSPYNTYGEDPLDYANAMKARAIFHGVEYIDIYNNIGFNLQNLEDKNRFAVDSTHLSDIGNRRIADILISYLNKNSTENIYTSVGSVSGKSLNGDGSLMDNHEYFIVTDFIEIEPGRSYVFSSSEYAGVRVIAYYDESQVFISSGYNNNYISKAPSTAKYMRFMTYNVLPEDRYIRKIINYDYQLVLNTNGGTVIPTIYHNEFNTPVIPIPTNTGYNFVGWYRDASLTDPFSLVIDTVEGDTTLYAKWVLNTPTGGGSVIIDNAANFTTLDYLLMAGGVLLVIVIATSGKGKKKGKWS